MFKENSSWDKNTTYCTESSSVKRHLVTTAGGANKHTDRFRGNKEKKYSAGFFCTNVNSSEKTNERPIIRFLKYKRSGRVLPGGREEEMG